ncbi:AAA family ATPase [Streptomyces scabiei]|uniref:NB-ARC domain-containing protein n=2 Tax=Streptomyces TaxID=1883 RepID=UPI000676F366|nr:NB-ARC domain-containing protein [Streptomyces scabiei]MDX2575401.1 AAA family ATPase [Streptomyces scabiei]MDX2653118.1 AAA family ATPase [Streptomyces scabiei]MDX2718876.1 AAA family ATPase [Streptomyces scabiei]MDX2865073.1 AAA family ATPase [Streptomyces scabiei]MDX2883578.1 AAA family ATPase [Streptomyces scabiei]
MDAERGVAVEASGGRSIASGGSIGMAFAGEHVAPIFVGRMTAPLPTEAYELPACMARTVNLPERARPFVGRERELAALDEAFADPAGAVAQVVHGLGGIGKSTLAAHWASERTDAYNPVWWITAETEADLDMGLADLAVALQPALGDVLSRRALRDLAVRWLSTHERWLLVLDNVSDPVLVKALLGRCPDGRFLITTRQAAGWQGIAETVPLDVPDLPGAVELFERVHDRPHDAESAAATEELCRELGCLPLAVRQAAAYCREAGITPGRYREQLASHPEQYLTQAPEGGRAIGKVWRVTLDRLADTPLAGEIFRVIAWWSSDGIRLPYLEPLGSPPEVTEAIRRLAAYSMITLRGDEISVHRLVQAVARAADPEDPHRRPEAVAAGRESAAAVLSARANDKTSFAHMDWFTHAKTLLGHGEPEAEQAVLLFTLVARWSESFTGEGGIEAVERATRLAERICGRRHETTLLARKMLANRLLLEGDWAQAYLLLLQNRSTTARMFGRKDPRTLVARAWLAHALLAGGRVWDAMRLAEKSLRKAERTLGDDHHVTAKLGVLLADVRVGIAERDPSRYAQSAIAEVERLRNQAVRREAGKRGEFSEFSAAQILTTNLMGLYLMTGDLQQVIRLNQEFANDCAEKHGESHAWTLSARMGQIELLLEIGDADRARVLLDRHRAEWECLVEDPRLPKPVRRSLGDLLRAPSP